MSSLMYADMGITAVQGITGYLVGSEAAKTQSILQRYRNTMLALSAAQAQNNVTQNQVSTRDQAVLQSAADQITKIERTEEARVAAAAAGVAGDSVDSTLQAIARQSAQQSLSRTRALRTEDVRIAQQRRGIATDVAYGKDISVIPRPSLGAALLGTTARLGDVWDMHNPTSNQTSTLLAK